MKEFNQALSSLEIMEFKFVFNVMLIGTKMNILKLLIIELMQTSRIIRQ